MNILSIIKQTYIDQLNALNYDLSDKYPSSWNKNDFISSIENIDLTNKKIIVEQYIDAIIKGLNIFTLEQNAYQNSINKLVGTKININDLEQILNQYLMEHPDANLLDPFKNPLNDKSLLEKLIILENGHANSFSSNIPSIDELDNVIIPTVSINTVYLQNQPNNNIEELTKKHKKQLKQAHDDAENARQAALVAEQNIRNLQARLQQALQNNAIQQEQIQQLQQQLEAAQAAHQTALTTISQRDKQIVALNDLHHIEMDELRQYYIDEIHRINAENIKEHSKLENNNQQLHNQIIELEKELHEKGNNLNQARKDIDIKNSNIVQLQEELARIKAARDLAILEKDEADQEIQDAQDERGKERIKINQENIPLINRLQAQVDELDKLYREKDSALNQLRRDLDASRGKIIQLEEELKQIKADRDLAIIKNDEIREQYQNEISRINANNIKEQARLQKEFDELIEAKNETIANLQSMKQNILKDANKSSDKKDLLLVDINKKLEKEKQYIDSAKRKLIKNLEDLTIKKNGLQDELNSANDNLRKNQSDMNFKDTLLANLRKQTADLRALIDSITIERDQARQNLARCEKAKGHVVGKVKELYPNIDNLENARQLLEEKESQLEDLKQKLEETNNLATTYYTKLLNKTTEAAASKAVSIAQIAALRVNANASISDLLMRFDEEYRAKINEEKAKRRLENMILELQQELKDSQKNVGVEHQSKIIEIQEKLKLQNELNDLRSQLRQLTNQRDELQRDLQQKNSGIKNYQEGLINVRGNNDERIERYQQSIQECEQRIKEKQQLIANKDVAILEANDRLSDATTELAKKTDALEKSQKEANKHIIELRTCREGSLQLRKEKEVLESRLQEMISNLTPNLADLQERLNVAEQKNAALIANNETTEDELAASQLEIARLTGEIAGDIAKRAGKDIELNILRQELTLTKRKLESIGELQRQLVDEKKDVDTVYGLLNTMMERKDVLESKVNELTNNLSKLQLALDAETKKTETLNKKLATAEGNIDTETRYSAAAQEEISRLEKELESTQLELTRTKSLLSNTRTEIRSEFAKNLDEALAEIESKKGELRQVNLDKNEAIKAAEDVALKIETLESKIRELTSNDDTNKTKISELGKELDREIGNKQSLELLLNQKTTEYAAAIATIIAKHAALETLSNSTLKVITEERDAANQESAKLRIELESLSSQLKITNEEVKRAQEATAAIISGQTTAATVLLAEQSRANEATRELAEIRALLATTQLSLDEITGKFNESDTAKSQLEKTLDGLRLDLSKITSERDSALAETEEVKRQCGLEQNKLKSISNAAVAETQRIQKINDEKDAEAEKILSQLKQCGEKNTKLEKELEEEKGKIEIKLTAEKARIKEELEEERAKNAELLAEKARAVEELANARRIWEGEKTALKIAKQECDAARQDCEGKLSDINTKNLEYTKLANLRTVEAERDAAEARAAAAEARIADALAQLQDAEDRANAAETKCSGGVEDSGIVSGEDSGISSSIGVLNEDGSRSFQQIIRDARNFMSSGGGGINLHNHAKMSKDRFKSEIIKFGEENAKEILKTIINELQISINDTQFLNKYLKSNPITYYDTHNKILLTSASEFWNAKDGYIFSWINFKNNGKTEFSIPENASNHDFFINIKKDNDISNDIIIDFMLFLIDYINEYVEITDAQLINLNKKIKDNFVQKGFGFTPLQILSIFETKFLNYLISTKGHNNITKFLDKILQPGFDRLTKTIDTYTLYLQIKGFLRSKRIQIPTTPNPTPQQIQNALSQYLLNSTIDDDEFIVSTLYDINKILTDEQAKTQVIEDLQIMRSQPENIRYNLSQEGGSNNQELLYNFVSAYIMLRAPIYNKSDKIQTIKDMITSSIKSSIKLKNNKIVKIKIPLIHDLLKIIMLPLFCESKGIKVTYENMFKCYKKNFHKLLSNKEITKYLDLFKLTKEQKSMLRQYDRRVASMMKILL